MSGSPLKKFVLTPVVLSATVFAALSLPLAVLGSKPVTIQLQQDQVFQGQLKDVATPYLGLVAAISLGAGIANVAVTGWRFSSRKSSQIEAQLAALARSLKEKEELLEDLKLSESRLEASGLSAFLDEEVTQQPAEKIPAASLAASEIVEPLVITAQPVEAQPVVAPQVSVQAAAQRFASAQTFLGFAHAKTAVQPSHQPKSFEPEVEELHTQLQQLMAQMASLQTALASQKALAATSLAVASQESVPTPTQTAVATGPVPLRVVKSWSVQEVVS
jgi:hypothetical protein